MTRVRTAGAVLATLLAIAGVATALNLESVAGTWSNVIDGTNITFLTVGDENQVRWGNDTGSGQSGLGFTPNASLPLLDLMADEEFEIGTLRHFNQPITSGTAATAVDLTVALGFSDPVLLTSSTFTLAIDETLNSAAECPGEDPPCPDFIFFPSAFPGEIFAIDGVTYALQILGFKATPEGPLLEEFKSDEGSDNSVLLYGQITLVCVRTLGYWKNHPDAWPVWELYLGDNLYTRDELVEILRQPVKGNGLVALAHQLIAAKLNAFSAPVVPPSVEMAIEWADALIDGMSIPPIDGGYLPPAVTEYLVEVLDEYNMGMTPGGPVSCDDIEEMEEVQEASKSLTTDAA